MSNQTEKMIIQKEIDLLLDKARRYKPVSIKEYETFYFKVSRYDLFRGVLLFFIIISLILLPILSLFFFLHETVYSVFFKILIVLFFSVFFLIALFKYFNDLISGELNKFGLDSYLDLQGYSEVGIDDYGEIEYLCNLNQDFKLIVNKILIYRGGKILLIDEYGLNSFELMVKYREIDNIIKYNQEKNKILSNIED